MTLLYGASRSVVIHDPFLYRKFLCEFSPAVTVVDSRVNIEQKLNLYFA